MFRTQLVSKNMSIWIPAVGAHTAVVLIDITCEDNRRCTFLSVLPGWESREDARLNDATRDTHKFDQQARRELTDTPQKPSMEFAEWVPGTILEAWRKPDSELLAVVHCPQ